MEAVEESHEQADIDCPHESGNSSETNIIETSAGEIPDDVFMEDILQVIENCPAVIRSQQLDEPELDKVTKRRIAKEMLRANPIMFLNKFGTYLREANLDVIKEMNPDSIEVNYYIAQLLASCKAAKSKVRNRRFEALQRLKATGTYFSDYEMEQREPLLYHQLVGQFLSEKEKFIKERQHTGGAIPLFSTFLIDQMDKDHLIDLQKSQEKEEEEQKQQYESSDDNSDVQLDDNEEPRPQRWGDDWTDMEKDKKKRKKVKKCKVENKTNITAEEKDLLLQEFTTHMHMKFLDGMDKDFDYSTVDTNPDYDCLTIRGQDEEEKYFDDESCSENNVNTDTGIEDY